MKKTLMIGPFPKPVSGVSLANQVVLDVLNKNEHYTTQVINTSFPFFDEAIGKFSLKKLFFYLSVNFKVFKIFSSNVIYITPGQTFFGLTKYSLFIMFSYFLRKELIIHVHGNYLGKCYENLRGIKKRLFKLLVSRFSKGIVLSKSLKNNLTPFLDSEKIYVLPNFAEEYLYTDTENKSINNKCLNIVFLSNLMQEKGILNLLDSLQELEFKNIKYKAKIAGNIDIKLEPIIFDKIKNLHNTEYIGIVYGDKKKRLLNWSNTFVLPTFYKMEGQPISILEALATNNIVITTNHAGIPDIIVHEKNGYFVEKNNVKSLTKTLIKLVNDMDKIDLISKNNLIYFKENFTVDIFAQKLLNIIDK